MFLSFRDMPLQDSVKAQCCIRAKMDTIFGTVRGAIALLWCDLRAYFPPSIVDTGQTYCLTSDGHSEGTARS